MKNNPIKFIMVGIVLLMVAVVGFIVAEFKTVKGGELGVKETWTDGVVKETFPPKNYILMPSWSQEIYTYDMRLLAFSVPEYTIRSADNQEMTIKSKVQWRRDPSKLVHHHQTFKQTAETVAIHPATISAILRHGTEFKAIDAYSGEGLIKMQKEIQQDLLDNKQLQNDGIIIESFIIESNHLRAEYLDMINARQLATLRQSKAIEEQKAAEAEALVAKSKAQADLNKAVVEAQRDKEVKVLAAQADQEKQILEAKGQSQKSSIEAEGIKLKTIAEAEGKLKASLNEAEGLLALGKAKAEAKRLELEAFAVKGSESYTRIEVAKSLADAFKGVQGYLPEKTTVSVLTKSFNDALNESSAKILVPATPSE